MRHEHASTLLGRLCPVGTLYEHWWRGTVPTSLTVLCQHEQATAPAPTLALVQQHALARLTRTRRA